MSAGVWNSTITAVHTRQNSPTLHFRPRVGQYTVTISPYEREAKWIKRSRQLGGGPRLVLFSRSRDERTKGFITPRCSNCSVNTRVLVSNLHNSIYFGIHSSISRLASNKTYSTVNVPSLQSSGNFKKVEVFAQRSLLWEQRTSSIQLGSFLQKSNKSKRSF